MRKILFFTMLSLSTTITLAEVGDNFFSIKLGSSNSNTTGITTFKTQGPAAETTDKDLGNSDIMEIGIGSYFSETFRGEISLAQRNGFKYATTNTKADGEADTSLRYKADVESLAVFINGYFNAQPLSIIQTSVTPYLGVGVGFSRNKMGAVHITDVDTGVNAGYAAGNTETEFAYKLALGTLINLSDNVSIDLSYQYVDLGNIKSGTNLSFDLLGSALYAPFSGPEITSSEFNVGLQVVF